MDNTYFFVKNLRDRRYTYREIAKKLGVSRQRAWQILHPKVVVPKPRITIFTPPSISLIKGMYKDGHSIRHIAREMGLSKTHLYNFIKRQGWTREDYFS
jgi:DNA invertase Pin-like site-specific DNA recombinase